MSGIYGSELIALYVIPSERTIFGPYSQSYIEQVKEEAQQYLDKVKDKVNKRRTDDNKTI